MKSNINEILTMIKVPAGGHNATYEVRQRQLMDWPLAAASVVLTMSGGTVVVGRDSRVLVRDLAQNGEASALEQPTHRIRGKFVTTEAKLYAGNESTGCRFAPSAYTCRRAAQDPNNVAPTEDLDRLLHDGLVRRGRPNRIRAWGILQRRHQDLFPRSVRIPSWNHIHDRHAYSQGWRPVGVRGQGVQVHVDDRKTLLRPCVLRHE